jgi:hypothetical protein
MQAAGAAFNKGFMLSLVYRLVIPARNLLLARRARRRDAPTIGMGLNSTDRTR